MAYGGDTRRGRGRQFGLRMCVLHCSEVSKRSNMTRRIGGHREAQHGAQLR